MELAALVTAQPLVSDMAARFGGTGQEKQPLSKSPPRTARGNADSSGSGSISDDEDDDDGWNRAAWFGWQFFHLRGAKEWMPRTCSALAAALADHGGPAHRFVGVARQRANCTGTLHSVSLLPHCNLKLL